MNPKDPVITRVSSTNPVPHPDALSPAQRATAERLRATIVSTAAAPPRHPRRLWPGVLAVASIVPVVLVVILVLGVHHRPGSRPGRGGASELRLPSSGKAQTLLLIGSDHRAGESSHAANTDAMLLVRIDPNAATINVLSVPRDLAVRIPGIGNEKLNAAYALGGPSALLTILRTQVFPGLTVNHIIDFNFQGFSDLVNALGCVYGDVDHRYINVNDRGLNTASDYSSIDLQAGYQRLCGAQALQFVRFRHTDSELVREARQQDFLRWVSDSISVGSLIGKRDRLFGIIGRYAQVDSGLQSTDGLLQLFDLVINSAGHPINRIPFPARLQPCSDGGGCDITATPAGKAAAYAQFLTTQAVPGSAPSRSAPSSASPRSAAGSAGRARLVSDASGGQAQASALGSPGLPVYYPTVIAGGSSYCSSATGNCRLAPNPSSRYANAYPRAYAISGAGRRYRSYRMTLVVNAPLGEYYGVQGTTWSDPPILRHPARIQVVNGRRLREYGTGSELSLVAFSTATGTYWVSNTLTDSIPAAELIAIAASMRPAA
jgi:polyisoprenyl-teichoic acid--peptidoglycan teichoic acid transferase